MISVSNTQRLSNLDFESYKLLPQYNFSFLKRERAGISEPVRKTDKIIIGSMVDGILTDGVVDMLNKLYPIAKDIASVLKSNFGSIIEKLEKQVSYTGIMHYDGFSLPVKGRPDFELRKQLIIDLKVTSDRDVKRLSDFMKYPDQQFNYGKLAGVKESYLMFYIRPLKKCEIKEVEIGDHNDFWADKIVKFGSV